MITGCTVDSLLLEGGRVAGVRTVRGDVRAQLVVDASGACAGRLGRESSPLPLKPLRRHQFVGEAGGTLGPIPRGAPFVWDLDAGYYVRSESGGLLLCPCDEAEHPPGVPAPDPAAAELLADKILKYSPGLGDVVLHRSWACLRTRSPPAANNWVGCGYCRTVPCLRVGGLRHYDQSCRGQSYRRAHTQVARCGDCRE